MPAPHNSLFLYTGPEFGKRNDAVDALKNTLSKKYGQIEEHLFYLHETPFEEVLSVLENGTLFSDAVCVVCKGAELLKKDKDLEHLASWAEKSSTSTLILVSDDISVDAKLEKLVDKENRAKFWEMYESDRLPWLVNFFFKNGYHIDNEAAELILEMVENNTEALRNECSRFFILFPKDHTISTDDVDAVLVHNREEDAFTLFDHISDSSQSVEKRYEDGVQILQKIRLSKDGKSIGLISGLTSCFRKLVIWHNINGKSEYGADEATLAQNGFKSKLMRVPYKKAAKIWTPGQATAILAVLAATDMDIRSGGALMEDVLLQKMLYEIVIKKGASLAAAEY